MANPFCFIELNTDRVDQAKKFYGSLFSWKIKDQKMGPGTYTMIDLGMKDAGGGMQKKPMPEAPTAWLPYVAVDDVKKTVAKARKLGATIVLEFMELPNMGSIGVFLDPTGAAIGVWAPMFAPDKKSAKKATKKAAKPAPKKAAKPAPKKAAKKLAKK